MEKEQRTNIGPVFTWGENEQGDTLEFGKTLHSIIFLQTILNQKLQHLDHSQVRSPGGLHETTLQSAVSIPLFLVCSLTHSIPKNVDYGTHEKRAHPVESNGSITVPVQNHKTQPLSKPNEYITHYKLHTKPDRQSKFSSYPQVIAAIMSKYMR